MLSDNRRRVHDLYLMSVSLARAGGGERVLPEILPASRVRVDPFTSRPLRVPPNNGLDLSNLRGIL